MKIFELLWFFFNLTIFVTFFNLCIQARKYFKESIGKFKTFFFLSCAFILFMAFGLQGTNSTRKNPMSNDWSNNYGPTIDTANIKTSNILLEDSYASKLHFRMKYGQEVISKEYVPLEACSFQTGIASNGALRWKEYRTVINLNKSKDKIGYVIYGAFYWSLLGLEIYSVDKEYRGVVEIKKANH